MIKCVVKALWPPTQRHTVHTSMDMSALRLTSTAVRISISHFILRSHRPISSPLLFNLRCPCEKQPCQWLLTQSKYQARANKRENQSMRIAAGLLPPYGGKINVYINRVRVDTVSIIQPLPGRGRSENVSTFACCRVLVWFSLCVAGRKVMVCSSQPWLSSSFMLA